MSKKLLTYSDLSARLSVPESVLHSWAHRGRIPGRVPFTGKTTRFDADIIEAWIQSMTQQPEGK